MNPQANPYARVADELSRSRFGSIAYCAETESTNADAAALLGDPHAFGRTIVAEHQTRGRGRKGRTWVSQPGASLMATTILPMVLDAARIWVVPFWTGLAVRRALLSHGIPTTLQWPNDVLIPGTGKLAGILCVSRITGAEAWTACGIGINVRRPPAGTGAPIEPPPAYCDDVAALDRAALLLSLLREYDRTLHELDDAGAVTRAWEEAARIPGAAYRLVRDAGNAAFSAAALALADGGGLVVRLADGTTETIALADVRALR